MSTAKTHADDESMQGCATSNPPSTDTRETPYKLIAGEWAMVTAPNYAELLTDSLMALKAVLECDQRTDCLTGNAHIKASVQACVENIERAKSL